MISTPQANFNRYKQYSTDLRRYYRMPAVQASLTTVLSLFIAAFFIFIALRPTFTTITTLKRTIAESEKTLMLLEQKAAALQKISTARDQYQKLIPYVDNAIPLDGPHYQGATTAIELLATESRVSLNASTYGDALVYSSILDPYSGANQAVISLPITAQVSGSFVEIYDYFQKLTSLDRLMTIDTVSFNRETKAKNKGSDLTSGISVTFTGKIHYMADQSQLSQVLSSEKAKSRSTTQSQEVSDVPEK